ncbi:hypothetical protein GDO78_021904, partial [Eleutherodactylus coqui]
RDFKKLSKYAYSSNKLAKFFVVLQIQADVVVANTFLNVGDAPYTRQYGGCGEQGQYIHFTPNFLLQENLTSFYGPYGKVFVHEWAHLRWGVFQEHNADQPFYISGKRQVEATRCSVNVNGAYRVLQHQEPSCITRPCTIHHDTGLFAQGCTFFPEKNLFAGESLMYSPGLQSISGFCDETNHNAEAPTMQNRMCGGHSTWDIIEKSSDIVATEPREDFLIPEPTFYPLRYGERVITLVIDISASMNRNGRMWRVHQAADMFLSESIAVGTYVGIVELSVTSSIRSELLHLTDDGIRESLKSRLPLAATDFGSDFCSGISAAFKVNRKSGSLGGTEIIFLAAGENFENSTHCFPEIEESGVIIHIIALSNEASKDLEHMADMTGGLKYFVTDEMESNDLIDSFIGIANENGGGSARVNQIESAAISINQENCVTDTVYIDSMLGAETFFTVTWKVSEIFFQIKAPDSKLYSVDDFVAAEDSHLSRMKIPETASRGAWIYSLCNNYRYTQALGIIVTSRSTDENVPPIAINVHMNTDVNQYPNSMIAYASVSQGLLPVKGAKVTAVITPEKGNRIVLELLDNGAGADTVKDDGIYSKYFLTFNVSGRYGLKVRVACQESECRLNHPTNRVFYLPGFVNNSKVVINQSRPPEDALPALGPLRRTAAGGSFMVSDVINTETEVYPPGKITDLEAKRKGDSIVLSWTATGVDLDQGNAQSYELRVSNNITELRDNFGSSAEVDITNLTPSPAGSPETFTFIPEYDIEATTIFYFALIAVDKDMQKSAPSNIAQAAIWVPATEATTQCPIRKVTTCTTKEISQSSPAVTYVPFRQDDSHLNDCMRADVPASC